MERDEKIDPTVVKRTDCENRERAKAFAPSVAKNSSRAQIITHQDIVSIKASSETLLRENEAIVMQQNNFTY